MKKDYNNIIYGIDIETSTVDVNLEDKCSFMYSYCICTMNFKTGVYEQKSLGRTYNSLSIFLTNLNQKANDNDDYYIIYIHNLAYEFSFFSNNVDFFRKHLPDVSFDDCIFKEKNKPLFIRLDRLEFRCSLSLLGKSIKTIGEEIGIEKLDFDYDKLRTPLTKLEDKEIEYNYRDVEIMLRGVYNLFSGNPYMKNTKDIPYTKTGVMRFNCEHNPDINVSSKYKLKNGKTKTRKLAHLNNYICNSEKARNDSQLRLWQNVFQGGFVYSNPRCCHQIIENVASYDFASDYPYQMLYRLFPSDFRTYKGDKTKRLNDILDWLEPKDLIDAKVSNYMFNAVVKISNLKACFDFQPLATSKIINISDLRNGLNCEVINGKIFWCDVPIKMYVTIIDMLMLKMFYTFNIDKCYYLEIAHRYSRTNEFKMNCVEFNARAKIEYKKYNNQVEHANHFKQYTSVEIPNTMYREQLNGCADYFEQLQKSNYLYQSVKSDLNSLYGDNAQHLKRVNYIYDIDNKDFIERADTFEDYIDSKVKTSYIYGVYVPQFARASIYYIIYQLLNNGYDILYVDTDSVKIKYDTKCDDIIEDFNKIQIKNLNEYDWTGFGVLEREYIADKFSSLGTKSYVKLEGDTIKATISGLPNATKLFSELYDFFGKNFNELIEMVYHYGTVFSTKLANKLASKYKFDTYEIDVDGYKACLTSGVVLEPVEVTMRDFLTATWDQYARLICLKYNYKYSDFCFDTKIDLNERGELYIEL